MTGYPPNLPGSGFPGQPPPRSTSHGCLIAGIVVGVVAVVAVVAVAVVGYVVLVDTDPPPPPTATFPQAEDTGDTDGAAAPPTTADTSDPPSPTADPDDTLKRSDLYDVRAMGSAGCRGAASVPLDNLANVTAYYRSALPCLNRAWSQTLKGTGIAFRPARLKVFSGSISTPCGGGLYSFYCGTTSTIYMYADEMFNPWNQYAGDDFSHGITKLSATHTIAHEMGHHIQVLAGFYDAVGTNWSGTEDERRLELQATCWANVWMSAQRGAYPVASSYWQPRWKIWRLVRLSNHGTEAHQNEWGDIGYRAARPGDCNTWVVGSGRVT